MGNASISGTEEEVAMEKTAKNIKAEGKPSASVSNFMGRKH